MEDLDMLLFDLGSAIALLLIAILGSYLPLRLYTGGGRSLSFQLGSMLSGGVMLSAGFCHLLADSLDELQGEFGKFPLGPFLCACGFLATLVVDQVAESYALESPKKPEAETPGTPLLMDAETITDVPRETHAVALVTDTQIVRVPIYTAVLLALSLCFHSILEGLALGTTDDIANSIDIAIAIFAHKGLAGYALGACVIESHVTKRIYWLIMGAFCIASPIGVMIGYAISEFSDSKTSSSLSALASGTFLYVALMEVIPNELKERNHIPLKLFMLLLGFGLMSIVAIWA